MSEQGQYRPDRSMWSPVQIESAIHKVSNEIANSVTVCGAHYETFLTADRVYDYEFARAYLAASGAVNARKYLAEVQTTKQREDRDMADAAYRLADRRSRALQDKLRALQSVGASIRAQYGVSGRGEGL